jgi:hypothetical protein
VGLGAALIPENSSIHCGNLVNRMATGVISEKDAASKALGKWNSGGLIRQNLPILRFSIGIEATRGQNQTCNHQRRSLLSALSQGTPYRSRSDDSE